MQKVDWSEKVTLWRRPNGIAVMPDPAMLPGAAKIDEGALSDMVNRLLTLPLSHRGHHLIVRTSAEAIDAQAAKSLRDRDDFPK